MSGRVVAQARPGVARLGAARENALKIFVCGQARLGAAGSGQASRGMGSSDQENSMKKGTEMSTNEDSNESVPQALLEGSGYATSQIADELKDRAENTLRRFSTTSLLKALELRITR